MRIKPNAAGMSAVGCVCPVNRNPASPRIISNDPKNVVTFPTWFSPFVHHYLKASGQPSLRGKCEIGHEASSNALKAVKN
jgi:hypothetical protein